MEREIMLKRLDMELDIHKTLNFNYQCVCCKQRGIPLAILGDQRIPDYDTYNALVCKDCLQLVVDNFDNLEII